MREQYFCEIGLKRVSRLVRKSTLPSVKIVNQKFAFE